MKPKPLPPKIESRLKLVASDKPPYLAFNLYAPEARAILAALEYERQRAEKAEQEAKAWKRTATTLPSIPPESIQAMTDAGREFRAAYACHTRDTPEEAAARRKRETAAVVPKPRKTR